MKIHDISLMTSPDSVTWDGSEQGYSARRTARLGESGSEYNVSSLTMSAHAGTHLDAPLHMVEAGMPLDAIPLDVLVGKAKVVEITGRAQITAVDLDRAGLAAGAKRVLLKTDNTHRGLLHDPLFHRDYAALSPGGAEWLATHGVRLVGIDYLSVGAYGPDGDETHRILLSAGVVVLESLALEGVDAGEYTLLALPPKLSGLEAGPCRCVLIEGDLN